MSTKPTLPHLSDGQIILRLATLDDAPAIAAYYQQERAVLAPFEPRRHDSFLTPEFWVMRVGQNQRHFDERQAANLFLFDLDNRTVLGGVNFSAIAGYPIYSANLGYSLAQSHWGRGLMRRALELAIHWAFEEYNLHRIAANHLPDNRRSANVLRRLGFVPEGYARDYLLIDGVWQDHVLNSLTRRDWQARDAMAQLVENGTGLPHRN